MRGTILRTAAIATLVLAAIPSPAGAQKAVGLALEVVGPVRPALSAFTEIRDGTVLGLASNGRLTFAHYTSCRVVTVVGGEVTIGRLWYDVAGGSIESEARGTCVTEIRARAAGGRASGLVLRAGPRSVAYPTRPAFVLVGRRAGDITSLVVTRDGRTLADIRLYGRRFKWPDDLAPLADGGDYRLVLRTRNRKDAFVVEFFASKTKDTTDPAALALLRVD